LFNVVIADFLTVVNPTKDKSVHKESELSFN